MHAIAYIRVSTAEQAQSGSSLDVQRELLTREAYRRGWSVEVASDEGISAEADRRPGLENALTRLDAGEAQVLMAVRLDRLSRSVSGFAGLLGRAEQHSWQLVLLNPGIDTTEPAGRFTTAILASAAQYERDLISQRTKEALAYRKASGGSLGRPRNVDGEVVERIRLQREQKMSLRAIAAQLNAENVPTAQGGAQWHASTVSAVLKAYANA